MRKTPILIAILLAMTSLCYSQDHAARLKDLMTRAHIPGLSLAYVKDGKVVESYYLGVRSNDTKEPVDEQTIFSAASLTKVAFAYGVMHLVEEGKLDLDKPLSTYFEYPDLQYDTRYKQITARQVLSHTSGLPNWRNGDTLKFKYNPGERWGYSGEGFVLLGKVVERITGKDVVSWMEETVLKPLGMDRSSAVWQKGFEADFARPHNEIGQTSPMYRFEKVNTAASLQTTAGDYGKLLAALLSRKGLKPATFKQMLQSQLHSQVKPGDNTLSWCLGVGHQQTPEGTAFWQWGDNGTFKGYVIGYPEKKEGLVYFVNSAAGLAITEDLLKIFFNTPQPAVAWVNSDDPALRDVELLNEIMLKPGYQLSTAFTPKGGTDTANFTEKEMTWLGYRLLQLRQMDVAAEIFTLTMQRFPDSATAYAGMGEYLLRTGQAVTTAQGLFAKAATLNPRDKALQEMAATLDSTQIALSLTKEQEGGVIVFKLADYNRAKYVSVAGSFNDWNDLKTPMRWINGAWIAVVPLAPGTYQYKFVVDGVWIPDTRNPKNKEGSFDSILEVAGKK